MESTKHLSLSELQRSVKARLEADFPLPVWVAAEIAELKVNYSGHCYLELVEKGGDNGVPRARASAVIWRSLYGRIDAYFTATTGQPLGVGLKVLLKVVVSYHELYGFSLQVQDVDPTYTLGDIAQQRLRTIEQLRADGVWDMNRELGLPQLPQRVAVISSATAAGYRDFCKELLRSPYRIETELFDAFMQGHGAEDSIVDALERVAAVQERFDLVVVIRGGGSQSDLSCFNSYRLCAHLAQFPLPVVTGIGHDKDESVADMVAALELKTPTAVAAWIVERFAEADARLDHLQESLERVVGDVLQTERKRVERVGMMLATHAVSVTKWFEMRFERLASDLRRVASALLSAERKRVSDAGAALPKYSSLLLAGERERLGNMQRLVGSYDPQRILDRGFAVVSYGGTAVTAPDQVPCGSTVEIRVAKGGMKAKITDNGKDK